jgi:hypothetical protein
VSSEHVTGLPPNTIRKHLDLLATMPDPPATFYAADIGDDQGAALKRLTRKGIVEQVEFERYDAEETRTEGTKHRWTYRLDEAAAARRDELLAQRETPCPCGHGGIRNLGNGVYACSFDGCNEQFRREAIDKEAMA